MKVQSVFLKIYEFTQGLQSKIGSRVHNRFEIDDFDIIMSDKVWWIETGNYTLRVSAEVHAWVDRYMKKHHNATWLYSKK